jgi:hypothetical protein
MASCYSRKRTLPNSLSVIERIEQRGVQCPIKMLSFLLEDALFALGKISLIE